MLTPVGEAPDEPAHIAYVQHLAREGSLPPVARVFDRVNYESHQPPLGYVVQAAVLRLVAPDGIRLEYRPDPSFGFDRRGSRVFLHPVGNEASRRAVSAMRLAQTGWLLLAVVTAMSVAARVAPGSQLAAAAFLLAPQLLFVAGVVNNDIAFIGLTSLTLLLLVRLLENPKAPRALAAGAALTAALFAKGSALFLGLPVAVAAVILLRRRAWRAAAALLTISAAGAGAWLAVNVVRFGTLMPPVPTAAVAGSVGDLLAQPRWIASLFVSFWAKFGWLNTPMPAPAYLWFAGLTMLALAGLWRLRSSSGAILASAIAGNLILVVLFMVTVDWQPQGRYLLPSVAPLAALGAAAGIPRKASLGLALLASLVAFWALAIAA